MPWQIGTTTNRLSFESYSDNNIYIGWLTVTGGDDRVVLSNAGIFASGIWASHVFTWDDAADDQKYYVDGTQKGSRAVTLDTADLTAGSSYYTVGNYIIGIANENCDSSLAEYAEWTAVLTASERAAYDAGYSPLLIRPSALQAYLPMARSTHEPVNGMNLTLTGASVASHPRIIMPRSRRLMSKTPPPPFTTSRQQNLNILMTGP